MAIVHWILVILALVCLLAAAFDTKKIALNLTATGLFLWLLSTLITSTTR